MTGPAAAAGEGTPRRALALLATVVFLMQFLVTGGKLTSPDEELLFRTAESIALRGSTSILPLEYDEEAGALRGPPEATFATRRGARGQFYAQYPVLQPLLAVPLVWIAHATEGLLAAPFARVAWPSMSHVHHAKRPSDYWHRGVVAMLFNPVIGALGALALAHFAMLACGSWRAGIGAAVLWAVGTIAWAHGRTFFTEPLAGLLGTVAMGRLLAWHLAADAGAARREALLAGAAMAAGVWARVDFPIIAAGLGLVAAGMWWHSRPGRADSRERLVPLLAAGAVALASFGALQAFNAARYGGVTVTAGYEDQSEGVKFTTPLLVGLHGLLASPGKGMLFFSPALVLGLWGWTRAGEAARPAAMLALAGWAPFFIAMAKWQNWDGGWCWGPRHVVQVHMPLMAGAAFLLTTPPTMLLRNAIRLLAAAGALVQLLGSSVCSLDYFTEYFRTPADGVYFRLAYRGGEVMTAAQHFVVTDRATNRPVSPAALPAPMVDSLYIPQETQWAAYPEMLSRNYLDLFWVRALLDVPKPPDHWKSP